MDDAGAVRSRDGKATFGREFQKRLVARYAGGACLGEAAGRDQQIADAAVGRLEDRVGPDHDHGEIDRRLDVGVRGSPARNRISFRPWD